MANRRWRRPPFWRTRKIADEREEEDRLELFMEWAVIVLIVLELIVGLAQLAWMVTHA